MKEESAAASPTWAGSPGLFFNLFCGIELFVNFCLFAYTEIWEGMRLRDQGSAESAGDGAIRILNQPAGCRSMITITACVGSGLLHKAIA